MKASVLAILLLAATLPVYSQTSPASRAWSLLQAGVAEKSHEKRSQAAGALALLPGNLKARQMAEAALKDSNSGVRIAAAQALGEMDAKQSAAALKAALDDSDAGVVLAAAGALLALKDPAAYDVYYEILTGTRKAKGSMFGEGMKTLHDPKKMALLGFEEGIGFVPFGGVSWGAFKFLSKDDVSPVRATAAAALTKDPDAEAGDALSKAATDSKWLVQVAALRALANRGDAKHLDAAAAAMSAENSHVQYTAAAAVIRLSGTRRSK